MISVAKVDVSSHSRSMLEIEAAFYPGMIPINYEAELLEGIYNIVAGAVSCKAVVTSGQNLIISVRSTGVLELDAAIPPQSISIVFPANSIYSNEFSKIKNDINAYLTAIDLKPSTPGLRDSVVEDLTKTIAEIDKARDSIECITRFNFTLKVDHEQTKRQAEILFPDACIAFNANLFKLRAFCAKIGVNGDQYFTF